VTSLQWDLSVDRIYECGLDRGVVYLEQYTRGVVWNGLVEVNDTSDVGSLEVFFDGNKIIDYPTNGTPSVQIKAFTYPDEFDFYAGTAEVENGLYLKNQTSLRFGLSYRTLIGDDSVGLDLGYKIHIWYGLVATLDPVSHMTMDDSLEPILFNWKATSSSELLTGYAPIAHVIIDSRYMNPEDLIYLEEIIYGTEETQARLPSLETLVEGIPSQLTIIITDHGDGTWSAEGPSELVYMLEDEDEIFEINSPAVVYLDEYTYTIESS